MIKGMTGFGTAQISINQFKMVVELKSLNHRYLDINYYLPIGFSSVENKIGQAVQKYIERGRVSVSVKIAQKPNQDIILREDIVKKYLHHARKIQTDFGLKNNLTLADLIKLPGVFDSQESQINVETAWPHLDKAINKSLISLNHMRKREGESLYKDVIDKLKKMKMQLKNIKSRHQAVMHAKRKTMANEEFSSYQKSADINEETSRLLHYIDELEILLKSDNAVGKKIDFIAQEMQRETNTIGSKMPDKLISNAVITLKSKIEKIREQAQNIE